jgi:uncharacterized protein YkwD
MAGQRPLGGASILRMALRRRKCDLAAATAEILVPLYLLMRLVIARMLLGFSICGVAVSATASKGADYPQRLAALVNQYRVSHGLPALIVDTTLSGLAREHSAAMVKVGQLNHDDFPSRVRRSGLVMCVENVGWNYRSPEGQFDGWRASPGHNRNMLDRRVDRMGIGIVADYVTLIACGK